MQKPNIRTDIIYLIHHLSKLLKMDFDERVATYGLTGQQARILFFVNGKTNIDSEVVHQNDIEREFSLAKSTVNGLIVRLEKSGFIIKKNQHPYAVIEVTDKAIEVIENIRNGRTQTIDKLFKGQDEKDKETVIKNLNMLIDNLEGGDKHDS